MKAIFLTAALAVSLAVPAFGQSECAASRDLADLMAKNHGEAKIARGLSLRSGAVIEFFVNPETGAWSAIKTTAQGTSCMIDHGLSFELIDLALPREDL